jgi:hypothetical protein
MDGRCSVSTDLFSDKKPDATADFPPIFQESHAAPSDLNTEPLESF